MGKWRRLGEVISCRNGYVFVLDMSAEGAMACHAYLNRSEERHLPPCLHALLWWFRPNRDLNLLPLGHREHLLHIITVARAAKPNFGRSVESLKCNGPNAG